VTQDLTSGIRRAAAPVRPAGHKAPSTAGINGGDPVLATQPPAVATPGAQAPAFPASQGRHEDRGWHEMHAVEMRGYTETLVALSLADGETLTLDPTRAQVWRVAVSGSTTIVVPNPSFPEPAVVRQDAPERMRTWSCVLVVSVPPGGSPPTISGAKWAEGTTSPYLKLADGADPEDWGGRYAFTLVHDPVSNDVMGFVAGARF
jgi:hypothetical protein